MATGIDDVLRDMPHVPDFVVSTDIGDSDSHPPAALMDNFAWESEERAESLLPDEMCLLAFAKAILVAADVAGSALWDGEGDEITRLVNGARASLQSHCKQEELKEIVRTRLKVNKNTDYEIKLIHFSVEPGTRVKPASFWRPPAAAARPLRPMNGRESTSKPDAS